MCIDDLCELVLVDDEEWEGAVEADVLIGVV